MTGSVEQEKLPRALIKSESRHAAESDPGDGYAGMDIDRRWIRRHGDRQARDKIDGSDRSHSRRKWVDMPHRMIAVHVSHA